MKRRFFDMVECGFSRRGIAIIQSYLMAALVIVYDMYAC
jgi:hypothetical protein